MEATGVYWKPVYHMLEGGFEILLVNARHVKHVPGRKTDVKDCEWLAQLQQCGLLKGSFVPPKDQRELRDLTRMRAQLVADRTRVANRVQKVLEDANIKLGQVASDVLGVSGRAMIEALIGGETDVAAIAEQARGRMRPKREELRLALEGRVTEHHRFQLEMLLEQKDHLDSQIARYEERIEAEARPFAAAVEAVDEIPGFDVRTAQAVIAEIGTDMTRFPTPEHLASWAGICPGNNESAGKKKSGKTTKGSRWLRAALTQAAWAASHKKGSYFQAQYRRLAGRRGKKRAIIAVAHSLLVVIHRILSTGEVYSDLGADYFAKHDPSNRRKRYLVRQLETMGYAVTLVAQSAA
jgi:transposase